MPNSDCTRPSSERSATLRALKRGKLHIAAEIGTGARQELNQYFENPWAPVERLAQLVSCFPTGLLGFWADHPRGHVLIGIVDQGYAPGEQVVGKRVLDGVAYVALEDVAAGSDRMYRRLASIVDHLLGSHGAASGKWLSDGHGITPFWTEVGQKTQELFGLGYGQTEAERVDVHAYFAHGVADFCLDRRSLNARDPLLEKLLRRSLMNPHSWHWSEHKPPASTKVVT